MAMACNGNHENQSLLREEEEEQIQRLPPLSPLTQYVDCPIFAIPVIAVFELEIPLDRSQTIDFLKNVFIPLNSRFSSVIVTDKKGIQRWKRVKEVVIENHVIVPTFPSGLTPQENEALLDEYMTKIGLYVFPEGQPPWVVHVFPYPTTKGAGTLVYKLSHALGDGYSLMGAIFKGLRRADNPSLPPTFPSSSSLSSRGRPSYVSRMTGFVSKCVNTVSDSVLSLMHGTFFEDDKSPVRSARPRVEFQPLAFSSVTFDIKHIQRIRSFVGGTVNDVTTGIMSYGLELYMKKMDRISTNRRVTAIVVLNMRMFKGFKSIEEMLKANIWGNYFGILHVGIPSSTDPQNVDPLEFIVKSKEVMNRKRNSLALLFTSKLLSLMRCLRCSEAGARYVHSTFKNTSMLISNMVGPLQKVVLADRPINSFYFSLSGVPQSLVLTVVSYDGKLRLVVAAEKGYIDCQLLLTCMKEAFERIYEAACGETVSIISN